MHNPGCCTWDVIKWKHFPRYWPFVREFTGPGEFPAQRPVTRSFEVFFDLRLNKRLSKQSWGWWFETLPRPLWRHSDELSNTRNNICLRRALKYIHLLLNFNLQTSFPHITGCIIKRTIPQGPILQTGICQASIRIMPWISNYINVKEWDVIHTLPSMAVYLNRRWSYNE